MREKRAPCGDFRVIALAAGLACLLSSGLFGQAPSLDPRLEDIKAQFEKILEERDSRQRQEIEALRKTIAGLTAQVEDLRKAHAPAPAGGTSPPESTAVHSPAEASPPRESHSQERPGSAPAAAPVSGPSSAPFTPKEATPAGTSLSADIPLKIYGSFRFMTGLDSNGISEIQDDTSRIGLKGSMPLGDTRAKMFAQAEVGVRLMKRDDTVFVGGDPGGPLGQANSVFSSRLGIIGIETPGGTLSWGKQYSVFYDIGGWTDQFFAWGTEAQGSFPSGTDGGVPGTGRADQAFQYRTPEFPLKFAFQAQNRAATSEGKRWADTLGASLRWDMPCGLSLGAAFNRVRDGIEDPASPISPEKGDRAVIYGAKYAKGPLYLAAVYARSANHQQDDQKIWFSARGFELFANVQVAPRWHVFGGFNDLQPRGDYQGKYRLRYLDFGFRFVFFRTSFVFLEIKPEDSRNADGSRGRLSSLAGGVYFNF